MHLNIFVANLILLGFILVMFGGSLAVSIMTGGYLMFPLWTGVTALLSILLMSYVGVRIDS